MISRFEVHISKRRVFFFSFRNNYISRQRSMNAATFIFFKVLRRNECRQTYELETIGRATIETPVHAANRCTKNDPARSRSTDTFTAFRYRSLRSWGSLTGIRYTGFTPATIASRVNKGVVLIKRRGSNEEENTCNYVTTKYNHIKPVHLLHRISCVYRQATITWNIRQTGE